MLSQRTSREALTVDLGRPVQAPAATVLAGPTRGYRTGCAISLGLAFPIATPLLAVLFLTRAFPAGIALPTVSIARTRGIRGTEESEHSTDERAEGESAGCLRAERFGDGIKPGFIHKIPLTHVTN